MMKRNEYHIMAGNVVTRIRNIRLDKNLKQEYVALKLGCSQNSYSKLEIGKTELTVTKLFHIAAILSVNVADLMKKSYSISRSI
jgi:transcriptional regulator with XRE-family HTH domain